MKSALFLDRDGVINEDDGYTHVWNDNILIPEVVNLIKRFKKSGKEIIIITNQSGIGRGFYSDAVFHEFMKKMQERLKHFGAQIDKFYYCGCNPLFSSCPNRKPMPGLFKKAASENNIKLNSSIMVGDKLSDLLAAHRAGIPALYLFDKNNLASIEQNAGFKYTVVSSMKEITG